MPVPHEQIQTSLDEPGQVGVDRHIDPGREGGGARGFVRFADRVALRQARHEPIRPGSLQRLSRLARDVGPDQGFAISIAS